ncbi:hypothetical protein DL93DRAFT_2089493 [Clavulina sp. PMI_390]|nr:hypothetical protein DL93DRAFT_2089493 [Clavulina sp. PMI_390]
MPPYVYIFPHKLREILILEIPKLYPVGTNESYKPILPASVTPHPFLSHDIDGLSWSSVIVLDRWKPPSLRSGIVVLHSRRRPEMGGNLFHVLSLHATDAPSCSREQLDSFLPYNDSEYACASLVNGPGGGMLLLDCLASLKVKEEPLDFRFFPFTNDGTLGEPIKRRHFVPFPYVGKMDPLCLVSGTAILKEECHGAEPNTQLVGIARFDWRSFKNLVAA